MTLKTVNPHLNYIDLFAGAGGLSEGFIRAGYTPIAHVEMDKAACFTLQTRIAYHYLRKEKKYSIYESYLKGRITRDELYSKIPSELMQSVINLPIGDEFNKKIHAEIKAQLKEQKVDLIIGGPPCQAYSLVGRARSVDGMKSDSRNHLYLQYAKFLTEYNPKMFVFENVLGLKSAGGGTYYNKMIKVFENLEYEVAEFILNAKDFGVLQNRKRIILIGHRRELKFIAPNFKPINKHEYKVKSIFQDLPELQAGDGTNKNGVYEHVCYGYLDEFKIRNKRDILTQHITRPHTLQDKDIYSQAVQRWEQNKRLNYSELKSKFQTHKNVKSFLDRFKVVADNLSYSQTVVAHIAKDGHYYIHPDINQNRSISVREAARLQSFPDNFYFEGVKEDKNRTAAFKQIGNAVPPLMAFAISSNIKTLLSQNDV